MPVPRRDPDSTGAPAPAAGERTPPLDTTADLLARVRSGDRAAREVLFARVLPPLRRWAHRRLPAGARDLSDTDDLVQTAFLRALARLDSFEARGQGAFLAYLRQILLNALRDEVRRVARRPAGEEVGESLADPGPSPLEMTMGRVALERYERGLARLTPDQQEAILLRVELDLSHQEIADLLGKPSANAARMFVARALIALAEAMDEPA
jgi:RNA polymerase sigma-70 factor (ECF subfamily)